GGNLLALEPAEDASGDVIIGLVQQEVLFDLDNDGTKEQVSIGDVLVLKYTKDPSSFDPAVRSVISEALSHVPKPQVEGVNGWNVALKKGESENKEYIINGLVKNKDDVFLVQSVVLPTETASEPLIIQLSLGCERCTPEQVGALL
ncbi:MAG: hypothetical protein WC595_01240, partial [Candidatus Nanoarchaeia archaeon]